MLYTTWRCVVIFLCFSVLEGIQGQKIIGRTCTVESSGASGTCKLITKCKKIRDELIEFNRLPQACGFQGTQAIVCCPEVRSPGDISKQKCREYSALKNGCGHKIVKRIVGGEKASREEFPHMAQLGFEKKSGETAWLCGGTIISEEYILTVGHCLKTPYGDPKFVRIGFTNVDDSEEKQELKVSEVIAHPDYAGPIVYNDLGLVKLKKRIQFSSGARPACLFTTFRIPAEKAIATGWGFTENGRPSKDLLKITVELGDYEFCSRKYKNIITDKFLARGIVDEEQICIRTDVYKEPRDTCRGDAGGPLQIYDGNLCMYAVIGVTSFGSSPCGSGTPSVYARVSHYVKWIEDIVWPQAPHS